MRTQYQIICMSFDGAYQRENPEFNTIEKAWDYSNDLGSKWFFYPFHFVVKNETIKDAPELLEWTKNKRIKTVAKIFNDLSAKDSMIDADCEDYMFALLEHHK